jgi:hypothetical protein
MIERGRPLLYAARIFVASGISVLPLSATDKLPVGYLLPPRLDADGNVVINHETNRPAHTWLPFALGVPDDWWLRHWFLRVDTRLGAICGAVSGHLEAIDFDRDVDGTLAHFDAWWAALLARDAALAKRLLLVRTRGGNRHACYRCPELTTIPPNHPIARQYRLHPEDQKQDQIKTLIETRGEHGYVVAPPSAGYRAIQGSYRALPIISAHERALLHELAAAQTIGTPRPGPGRIESPTLRTGVDYDTVDRDTPWGRFNAQATNESTCALLAELGWDDVGDDGTGRRVRRPGGRSASSGTVGISTPGWLHVFSSNGAPFQPSTNYSPFAVYAVVRHGADYHAAAWALGEAERGERYQAADGVWVRRAPTFRERPVKREPLEVYA